MSGSQETITEEQNKPDLPKNNDVDVDSINHILQAAGIGTDEDDPTEPILTLRMWFLGIIFCILASGLNTLYTLRTPSLKISASVVLLLAFPLGRLWEKTIPSWDVRVGTWSFNLNPGPFNEKEHVLIYIMSNLSVYVRLGADVLTEQQMFYGYSAGWAFQILITIATFLIGFCLAGLFRAVTVAPRELIWPGALGVTALTATLHKTDETRYDTWKISRYSFFCLVFSASFCWYWLPDLIMPVLSYFNFPCWIKPQSAVVNQLFGMKSGMGLIPITFDWSQISYVGSPLLVPAWAIMNVSLSLVLWIWIVAVVCYYRNLWDTAYLPFQSSKVFDNTGNVYKASKIVNAFSGYRLDVNEYLAYSPVYMPIAYALNMFGLSFASLSALVVWVILEHRAIIVKLTQKVPRLMVEYVSGKFRAKERQQFKSTDVPIWWYLACWLLALFMAIFAVEYWAVELRWYGVLLAFAVALVFYTPLSIVYGTSNLKINIDVLCRIVAGLLFEGKVLANIWFFDLGYITTIKGLYFAQDMKLATYCKIPQRQLFWVQCVGMLVGSLSSLGVLNWAFGHISGVCTSAAINGFSCPYSSTHFNTSLIWGAIGPRRYFSSQIGYSSLLYFFVLGAILPIAVHLLRQRYPSSFWKKVHVPLFVGGLNYLPPATGMNYGSWALLGLAFGIFIRRRWLSWWTKFNFVLSSALDSSVGTAGVLIFLTIYFTGASDRLNWWGTKVYKETCDWKGCPHLQLPEGGKFGVSGNY
ncbi:OPT oligopeptide transporter protein-domain-containing protein [Aspergillus ambiguus]|uniref:OPT oligopeptide transporter protein-domain-containing protein n=1 Tax=Aspergillus ambiguus TaxID=176160 RepID=UPI003CCDADF4